MQTLIFLKATDVKNTIDGLMGMVIFKIVLSQKQHFYKLMCFAFFRKKRVHAINYIYFRYKMSLEIFSLASFIQTFFSIATERFEHSVLRLNADSNGSRPF